ncbi:chitin deacetylase [Colletotrichum plurivorum]|uniref:Chitin deacetylase n=1 Tax=Colletotrichum plurivorum TaxID=2175906 RepID=A0A8H6K1E7_9PEZI|nr:chitin deacetylase [Colletotrichum plurivorum]
MYSILGLAVLTFVFPLGTVASPSFVFSRAVSPDNSCGTTSNGGSPSGYTCPTDLPCCSTYGWCGSTDAYCLTSNGCQGQFGTCTQDGSPPTDTGDGNDGSPGNGQCGPANGNAVCAVNECCSAAGFCGSGPDYCRAPDCQFQFGPACDANKTPPGLNTSSIARNQLGQVAYGGPGVYSCVNPGDVALTFDDGPDRYTNDLLDLLKKYNASATFMVTGNNNAKGEIDNATLPWANVIKPQTANETNVASAKLRRPNAETRCTNWKWFEVPDSQIIVQEKLIVEAYKALRNIIGVFPTPPFSSCTAECGCEDDMAALGYSIIYFDLDTEDYLHDSPTEIIKSKKIVDQALAAKPGATDNFLVIGHDIHQQTVYNLAEYMLQRFKAKKMVTLGDCLGDPKQNWYRTDARTTLG